MAKYVYIQRVQDIRINGLKSSCNNVYVSPNTPTLASNFKKHGYKFEYSYRFEDEKGNKHMVRRYYKVKDSVKRVFFITANPIAE